MYDELKNIKTQIPATPKKESDEKKQIIETDKLATVSEEVINNLKTNPLSYDAHKEKPHVSPLVQIDVYSLPEETKPFKR